MERKYGPKPRSKDRDTTAKRFVARRKAFGPTSGERTPLRAPYAPKSPTRTFGAKTGGYVPRTKSTPFEASPARKPYTPRTSGSGYTPEKHFVRAPGVPSHFKKAGQTGRDARPAFKRDRSDFSRGNDRPSYGAKKTFTKRESSSTKRPVGRSVVPKPPRTASASWGSVATWYDTHLKNPDTYHEKVILPNLLRLIDPKKGDMIADLACGQGIITKELVKKGATVTGVDVAEELIDIAKTSVPNAEFHVGDSTDLPFLDDAAYDKVVMNLAIQNIDDTAGVLAEVTRILKMNGSFFIVMNHPAFRIPKRSQWTYDEKGKVQYRRVDEYLSESKATIDMHPGIPDTPQTLSFHRPLQYYFKLLTKNGLMVTRLEEWISHKISDSGPRAKAENKARKEFPLFLYLEAKKIPRN